MASLSTILSKISLITEYIESVYKLECRMSIDQSGYPKLVIRLPERAADIELVTEINNEKFSIKGRVITTEGTCFWATLPEGFGIDVEMDRTEFENILFIKRFQKEEWDDLVGRFIVGLLKRDFILYHTSNTLMIETKNDTLEKTEVVFKEPYVDRAVLYVNDVCVGEYSFEKIFKHFGIELKRAPVEPLDGRRSPRRVRFATKGGSGCDRKRTGGNVRAGIKETKKDEVHLKEHKNSVRKNIKLEWLADKVKETVEDKNVQSYTTMKRNAFVTKGVKELRINDLIRLKRLKDSGIPLEIVSIKELMRILEVGATATRRYLWWAIYNRETFMSPEFDSQVKGRKAFNSRIRRDYGYQYKDLNEVNISDLLPIEEDLFKIFVNEGGGAVFDKIEDSDMYVSKKSFLKFVFTLTEDLVGRRKEVTRYILDGLKEKPNLENVIRLTLETGSGRSIGFWYRRHIVINELYRKVKSGELKFGL